jgi:predicted AAA+ superfamily ATPase
MENLQQLFFTLLKGFDKPYKRYFFDRVDFNEKLIGILGDRGIGKTTFLLQYLKESSLTLTQKLYINAEYISMSSENLFELAQEFSKKGGKLLVVDEIHNLQNFEQELKLIYDYLDLKVIFSGSSAIKLEHSKADLSRRAVLYRLQGLSFREFLELKLSQSLPSYRLEEIVDNHIDIALNITSKLKVFEYFREYLECGYYPFYFDSSKESFRLKLNEAINATIEFDLSHIFNIEPRFIIKLKQLIMLICQSKPYELNISKLAQKIEINRNTLYQYIYYLSRGSIFSILHSEIKGDAIFTKPQKLYLANTNLNFAYCESIDIGTIRESFVLNQLRQAHTVAYSTVGDFLVDGKFTIEVGGKNKSFNQIKDIDNSFLAVDDVEIGVGNKIPLWLFGFLY